MKREKAMSHEKATEKIFIILKKEFCSVSWMNEVLEKLENDSLKRKH